MDSFANLFSKLVGLGVDVCSDRCRAVLDEERSRLEAARREIAVLRLERDGLLMRLEAAKKELMT